MKVNGLVSLLKVLPKYNAHRHHAETKQEVLDRYCPYPYAHEKKRIIHHNEVREVPVHHIFKNANDSEKYPVELLPQDMDTTLPVKDNSCKN